MARTHGRIHNTAAATYIVATSHNGAFDIDTLPPPAAFAMLTLLPLSLFVADAFFAMLLQRHAADTIDTPPHAADIFADAVFYAAFFRFRCRLMPPFSSPPPLAAYCRHTLLRTAQVMLVITIRCCRQLMPLRFFFQRYD